MSDRDPTASERAVEVLPCFCNGPYSSTHDHHYECPAARRPAVTAAIRSAERAAAARVWREAADNVQESRCDDMDCRCLSMHNDLLAASLRARAEAEEREES